MCFGSGDFRGIARSHPPAVELLVVPMDERQLVPVPGKTITHVAQGSKLLVRMYISECSFYRLCLVHTTLKCYVDIMTATRKICRER